MVRIHKTLGNSVGIKFIMFITYAVGSYNAMPINSSDKKTNSKCIIYKVPNAYQCIACIETLFHRIEITQEGENCTDPRMPQAYHHDEQLRDWE
jgi:hypothetical protein